MTVWEGTGGRFDLEEEAGAGGMGMVFRARDRQTGGLVAVKFLYGKNRLDAERFAREAEVLRALSHPGIVKYVAHGTNSAGAQYLAMEWLEGETLAERLRSQRLTLAESLGLARRVAEALAGAHERGVVHRDIKPSNLFLRNGRVQEVKIIDFGVARRGRERGERLTGTGKVMGTPAYMAPEQARGAPDVDARADLFALGCVLYECLTGEQAFVGLNTVAVHAKILLEEPPRLRERASGAPEEVDALVHRLMAKRPEERPQAAGFLVAEIEGLERLVARAGARAHAPPPAEALTRRESRVVSVVVAGGVGLMDEAAVTAPHLAQAAPQAAQEAALRRLVVPFGARLEPLADGSVVVSLSAAAILSAGAATDQAARAARCALALRQALPYAPMSMATGRGEVAARGPVGDVIDRATQVLGRAGRGHAARVRAGAIWLDDATASLLDARFEIAGEPGHQFLRGERDLAQAARTVLGKVTTFVGRDRELSTLADLYAECVTEPTARAVLVTGPAGSGKSRLRHELSGWLERREHLPEILFGRGDSLAAGAPFGLIAPAIRRAAGIDGSEPTAMRRDKLRVRLGRSLEGVGLQKACEFLGELIHAPVEDGASESLRIARQDLLFMGDLMRASFVEWLDAEAGRQPLVLVLEDLQWGDLPSLKFIEAALRSLVTRPFFVLALARPEVHDRFPALWRERGVQELRLGELSRKASERLVREVLGPEVDAGLVQRIVDRAEGNPFYLEELMRALSGGASSGALPDTVLGMVQARLDALGPEAKRILRAASVYGRTFRAGGLAALLSDEKGGVGEWLDELVDREVVFRQPGGDRWERRGGDVEYVFRHQLVQEAAYAMLTDADRRLGHRLAGEWLEHAGDPEPVALAEHFERGGTVARAVHWHLRGAFEALEGNDLEAVAARARRGLASARAGPERGSLQRLLAEALFWRGEIPEAGLLATEAAAELVPGSHDWFRAVEHVLASAGRQGHYDRVAAWIEKVLGTEPEKGAEGARITCLCRGIVPLIYTGREQADALIGRLATEAAARDLDRLTMARVHRVCAARAYHEGDSDTQLEEIQAAFAGFLAGGDLRNACFERGMLGFAYADLGDYHAAEEELRLALEGAERMGLKTVRTVTLHNLGHVLANVGKLPEARALEEQALSECREQGNRRLEGGTRMYLATIAFLAGDHVVSEEEARLAVDLLTVAPPARAGAVAAVARAQLGQGEILPALASAREAAAAMDAVGAGEYESLVRLILAEALHAAGDADAARATIRAAADRLRARAARIKDPRWRQSFLRNVRENARTLELERSY